MSDDANEGVMIHYSHWVIPDEVITPHGLCLLGTNVMLPI